MGLLELFTRPMYQPAVQKPWDARSAAEIVAITPKGGDLAVLEVNIYTGDESPWQEPRRDTIRTILPKGVRPRIGQRVMVG